MACQRRRRQVQLAHVHLSRYRRAASSRGEPTHWQEFLFGFLDGAGEALVDDISVLEDPDGAAIELIQNGSFDNGLTHWRVLGNHQRSRVIDDQGNQVLQLVSSGATEYQGNQVETTFAGGACDQERDRVPDLVSSSLVVRFSTAQFAAVLQPVGTHDGAWRFPTPTAHLGRPIRNAIANAGPTFDSLQHAPVIPLPGETVQVTVMAADPDGLLVASVVRYRVDSGALGRANR